MVTIALLYVLLKLFVADIGSVLANAFWPSGAWMLDYRALYFLIVVSVVATFFWHWNAVFYIAHGALFPFVVFAWKLPNLVIRLRAYRSWMFWMLVFNGSAVVFRNLRYLMISISLTIVATVMIILAKSAHLLVAGAIVLSVLLLWTDRWFLRSQKRVLDTVASDALKDAILWGEKAKSKRDGESVPAGSGQDLSQLKVPSLASTVFLLRVVAEQVDGTVKFYVATAHRYVRAILEATTDWLRQRSRAGHDRLRLGLSVNLLYDNAAFYQDAWLAGHS